jgi:translation elongation factor EF-Tu-like GTPase
MNFVMTVEDAFLVQNKGVVISGANERLDSMRREEIRNLIGERIRILNGGEDLFFDVLDVAFSESLAGKKNVSILLEASDETSFVRGDEVFTAENSVAATLI